VRWTWKTKKSGRWYSMPHWCTATWRLIGALRRSIPDAPAGYYSLGRWLRPVCAIFIAWAVVVIACLVAPSGNRVIGLYVAGFEVAGLLWWLAALRRRLRAGTAGPVELRPGYEPDSGRLAES
jgi:hypothetical protein